MRIWRYGHCGDWAMGDLEGADDVSGETLDDVLCNLGYTRQRAVGAGGALPAERCDEAVLELWALTALISAPGCPRWLVSVDVDGASWDLVGADDLPSLVRLLRELEPLRWPRAAP